ncbi:hypothetical protein TKK_0008444 [Trichogramma kaykai]
MRDERRPNHEKLETLEVLRENVNWEIVEERHRLIEKLFPLIAFWDHELPNLRKIFREEEIERLLFDSLKLKYGDKNLIRYEGAQLIQFVARSGYKHQPQFDEHGKPLLNRITPIH